MIEQEDVLTGPTEWPACVADPTCPTCHGTGKIEVGSDRHYVSAGMVVGGTELVECSCVATDANDEWV